MDRLNPERRSHLMSRIKSKDTRPEMAVRSYLHARGLRYRLHDKSLPGRSDLVFKSRKVAVFVHGCFWHGHPGCTKARIPETRQNFWRTKIENNALRDRRSTRRLRAMGWRVLVVWQCRIGERRLSQLYETIAGSTPPEVHATHAARSPAARASKRQRQRRSIGSLL